MRCFFAALTLLTLAHAACLGKPDPIEPSTTVPAPAWGLGLDLSSTPAAGPFLENVSQLALLNETLRRHANHLPSTCGGKPASHATRELLEDGHLLAVVDGLYTDCHADLLDDVERWVKDAMAAGREASVYGALRRNATWAMNASESAIGSIAPDTLVEAELLDAMIRNHMRDVSNLGNAERSFQAYRSEGEDIHLKNAFFQLAVPWIEANVTRALTSDPLWSKNGGCLPSGASEWAAEADRRLAALVKSAASKSPSSDALFVSNMYGKLLRVDWPNLNYSAARGWESWPLRTLSRLSWDEAYWSNDSAPRLPNREEARYLVSVHESRGRTLATEAELAPLKSLIDDAFVWEHEEVPARQSLALAGFQSAYLRMPC